MFTSSPRYSTLTQQVAQAIEEQIRAGVLREALPGERRLGASMQVGRRTIRAAVAILAARTLVRVAHGLPTRILRPPAVRAGRPPLRSISLVVPQSLHELQPHATVFIDPLRTLLNENGFRLDTHVGRSFFSRQPGAALRRLVARFPCDAWLLAVSNRSCQTWFHARGLPAVVIGSSHEGVALPCIDLDMQATTRHAAQLLLRRGHRRLGLVIGDSDWVGERRTEEGFLEGVRQFGRGAQGRVFKHAAHPAALRQLAVQVRQGEMAPTALVVANPYTYLTLSGLLAEQGVRVPRDLSLLCREDEYCFRHLAITPSRYVYDPHARAKVIFATLMAAMRPAGARLVGGRTILMFPRFLEGASIAPPRTS